MIKDENTPVLGEEPTLFVGKEWAEWTSGGIVFGQRRPDRREEVLYMDKPWEGPGASYLSVIDDGECVKLYYRGCPAHGHDVSDENDSQCTCLAESRDGINFYRPDYKIVDYNGDHNNIILKDKSFSHNFAPFYDDNPDAAFGCRYKAVAGEKQGLFIFGSDDGINWRKLCDKAVITDGSFDSLNTAFYDAKRGVYRCYSRYFSEGNANYAGYRSIQSCESEDFVHWTPMTKNVYVGRGEQTGMHFYTNATRPLPGSPDYLVAFPMRFQAERKKVPEHDGDGISDCMFMYSRDGYLWDIPSVQPWIYPGVDEKVWTDRNFITSAGCVHRNKEHSVYVVEHYNWSDCKFVRYSVPEFRFGYAYSENGTLVTRPFVAENDELKLNYMTSAYGSVKIEVLDENYRRIAESKSDEIYGNETDYVCKLKNGVSLRGKTVRLKFTLKDAAVFAISTVTSD